LPRGEVVGFDGEHALVMLFDRAEGIEPGTSVIGVQTAATVRVGMSMLGRVVNGLGQPIDGRLMPIDTHARALHPAPTQALRRRRIIEPLPTGVRSIDGFLTLGKGQRIGIFSGAGVGKSTLLGQIARSTAADVNVVVLVGERGREVRDFIEKCLGDAGMKRSVVVVATGDESPLMRVRAAFVGCAYAEHFREQGADVCLMMDSVTRFAQAQRQIGLAAGEQPATKGYTPSVFAMLPVLLERAGALEGGGSITGLYAVLVDGDDLSEPVSDAARGVLDGHIVLSRRLATRGHFPAIDVTESISRVADDVCDQHHIASRRQLLRLIAAYKEAEDLISIGAYARGSNGETDAAIAIKPILDAMLRQRFDERSSLPETCRTMIQLCGESERAMAATPAVASAAATSPAPSTRRPARRH
jgi:FliI/YscN family ATPase